MTHEPIGNRLNIASGSTNRVVEIILVYRSRVISAESLIVVMVPSIKLLQAVSGGGSLSAIPDHLENATSWVAGVESDTSVGLHDARISNTVVGSTDTDVAAGFLHDDAKNSAGINAGFGADFFYRSLDEADFAGTVVEGHQGGILGPESAIISPGAWGREV